MELMILLVLLSIKAAHNFLIDNACTKLTIASREKWGARAPVGPENLTASSLDKVFVHHTDMSDCTTFQQCATEVRTIQNLHMDERGWGDVGYSFLVGEDGVVYEGRGWHRVGAHTYSYNRVAYGIAVLGNFMYRRPNVKALTAVQTLLACGVQEGHVTSSYRLYGHRDTGQGTLCPGDVLYGIIQKWNNFDPAGPKH